MTSQESKPVFTCRFLTTIHDLVEREIQRKGILDHAWLEALTRITIGNLAIDAIAETQAKSRREVIFQLAQEAKAQPDRDHLDIIFDAGRQAIGTEFEPTLLRRVRDILEVSDIQ